MENPNRNGILAIGNLLVDRTLLISEYPQESMLATISKIELHCGGGCTNILFDLAKLDPALPLYLGGAVGKDGEGQFFRCIFIVVLERKIYSQHRNGNCSVFTFGNFRNFFFQFCFLCKT